MIKPQDVPEDFVGIAEELFEDGHWSNNTKVNVARFLNAAIEAGIVSPPVRILRSKFGVLEKGVLYVDDNEAQSHASPGGSSEHYRGQTE